MSYFLIYKPADTCRDHRVSAQHAEAKLDLEKFQTHLRSLKPPSCFSTCRYCCKSVADAVEVKDDNVADRVDNLPYCHGNAFEGALQRRLLLLLISLPQSSQAVESLYRWSSGRTSRFTFRPDTHSEHCRDTRSASTGSATCAKKRQFQAGTWTQQMRDIKTFPKWNQQVPGNRGTTYTKVNLIVQHTVYVWYTAQMKSQSSQHTLQTAEMFLSSERAFHRWGAFRDPKGSWLAGASCGIKEIKDFPQAWYVANH